jgi:hypothetical protein
MFLSPRYADLHAREKRGWTAGIRGIPPTLTNPTAGCIKSIGKAAKRRLRCKAMQVAAMSGLAANGNEAQTARTSAGETDDDLPLLEEEPCPDALRRISGGGLSDRQRVLL